MKESEIISQAIDSAIKAGELVVVKSIAETATNDGKKYYKVEFADGSKVNVWNPKQLDGIHPGSLVSYELKKNDKGYWNLNRISKAPEADPMKPPAPPEEPLFREATKSETLSDKEHAMRSMNALTNSVTFVCALINKDIIQPKTSIDAYKMVTDYHKAMLKLHNEGETTK